MTDAPLVLPADRVSAHHDGQILAGTVLRVAWGSQTFTLLTAEGIHDLPLASIVSVEPVVTVAARARRHDPAHPDEPVITGGLGGWELVAAIGACVVTVAAGVVVAVGLIALAQHTYRWLT